MAQLKENAGELNFSPKEKLGAYWRFIKIIWRENKKLAFSRAVLLVAGAFLQPLEIYFFAQFIAAIAAGHTNQAPFLLAVVIISYALRNTVNELTYSRMNDWFEKAAGISVEKNIYEHLSKLDPESLFADQIRRSLDFVREDLWRLNRVADTSEWFLRSILKLVGTLGLAFAAPWWVTVLALADASFQAANFWFESKRDIWTAVWNSLDGRRLEYTRFLFLNAQEFRELRLLGAEKTILKKRSSAAVNVLNRFKAMAFKSLRNRGVLSVVHAGAYALVIIVLGTQAFAGPEALAALYVALNLFGLMGESLNGISGSVTRLWSDMEIMAYMNVLLNFETEPEIGLEIPRDRLVVTFNHVTYRYPDNSKDALVDVNLEIKEGEHLAIVGENGAGKSTLLKLLCGLIRPTSGSILLNGRPLSAYKPEAWRSVFHLMLQDARLYQDFVKDNLMYGFQGRKKNSSIPFEESNKIAGADVVIDFLPRGHQTFIGDWAAPPGIVPHRVSGGQQQRLLISRTLIHGGRIIGFDEPTSAMDANAEMKFFERMLQAAEDRGLIFISHRFSTVRRASRIFVFDEGRLIEDGSHVELMSKNGKYAELYKQQAQWYA
ncbi:MAG: ABC transporter ATP-binding protein [Patescibacteria group bacterium]|nr:ABC transporter ATP-binding protein [Patescibacteria group bacterium]